MDNRRLRMFVIGIILGVFIICPVFIGEAFAQTAEQYFQQGKAYLENQQLSEAYTNFQNALALDPNHQGANLFYAITRILMISQSTDFNTLLDRAGVSSAGRDIFNWTADFTRNPEGKIVLPSNSPTGEELQNFLKNNILPEVNGSLNNLTKVGSEFQTTFKLPAEDGMGSVISPNTLTDPGAYWMTNEWAGHKIVVQGTEYTIVSNTSNTLTVTPNWVISPGAYNYRIFETVEIDYGDVLVFKGSLYLAKGGILILSAYNVNVDIDAIVTLYNSLSLNFQNHVINTYTQFLTLLPGQELSEAKSILRDAFNTFSSAINLIVAEGDSQTDDLIVIDDPLKAQEYRDLLGDLNSALDGTTYIRKIEEYLNLSQFFDYPKILRNYLPLFRGQYFIQGGSFPDPTFGGILPYMTANLLDERLKNASLFVAPPPTLRPYDDFSGTYIDKSKWRLGEWVREIDTGSQKLNMKQASPNPVVITTYPYSDTNALNFYDPGSLNTIQADIAISNYSFTNQGYTRARIAGRWYNDGTVGAGMIGDIFATVELRAGPEGLTANCGVSRMTNAEGTTSTSIAWRTFTTAPTLGTPYTLFISYDGTNNFTFMIGTETITLGPGQGIPARAGGAKMPWKALQTRVQIDNSASSAYISATFDNVYKNGVLYDNFSSSTIDPAKWITYEWVREVSGGKLRSGIRSQGANLTNNLNFFAPERIKAINAKVTPTVFNNPDGALSSSLLRGHFFRNMEGWWWYYSSPPGGSWGNVWAEIGIGGSGTTPSAYWAVLKYTNIEGTTWEILGSGVFSTPITLGSTYDLYMYWDGSAFTFKCNHEEAIYAIDPPDPIYFGPPTIIHKGLQTRIQQMGTNQKAFIESTFDDVMIYAPQKGNVDFDGDSKTDIAVYRSGTGAWYIYPSGGGSPYGFGWGGDATDKPTPGDYDGDGKIDIAVYRSGTGAWYIYPSGGGSPYGFGWGGDASDKPAPGDYDGDGKTDIAVYRAGTGAWYVYPSGGGSPYGLGWGGDSSDKPAPGDYDGDGKTDIAVYRAGTGAWYVIPSAGATPYGVGWGGDASDKPTPGDYDGDGKTDIAVYRAGTGAWYVYPSGGGSPYGMGWGGDASDKPAPGDYDGDGKTDIAVYRTSTGAWYVFPSGGGTPYGVGWGGDASDKPVAMNLSAIE